MTTNAPPGLEKMPEPCPVCDAMTVLGLGSSICETLPSGEKAKCHQLLKPLEDKKATAIETLAAILFEIGNENVNQALDRMNVVIWQATEKAKERLITAGRLNKDGTPIK